MKIILRLFLCAVFVFSVKAQSSNPQKSVYIEPTGVADFVRQLNELGQKGYKLKVLRPYAEDSPQMVESYLDLKIAGIAEFQKNDTFEYEWFRAVMISQITEQATPLTRKGFYFDKAISYQLLSKIKIPEVTAPEGSARRDIEIYDQKIAELGKLLAQEPLDENIFLLERKNKYREPVEFQAVTITPQTSIFNSSVQNVHTRAESIEKAITEVDTANFYPVSLFYAADVFKNMVANIPVVIFQNDWEKNTAKAPNYKAISRFNSNKTFRSDMVISKTGYNLALIMDKFALFKETGRKVSYEWIDPNDKNFLQILSKNTNGGGRFISDYDYTANFYGHNKNVFVFETSEIDDGARFEYQALKLSEKPKTIKNRENKKEVLIETSEPAKQKFRELTDQGYTVRSMFYGDGAAAGMNVLLERTVQKQ